MFLFLESSGERWRSDGWTDGSNEALLKSFWFSLAVMEHIIPLIVLWANTKFGAVTSKMNLNCPSSSLHVSMGFKWAWKLCVPFVEASLQQGLQALLGTTFLLASFWRHSSRGPPAFLFPLLYNLTFPDQWSPTFLAPGTGFVENNFSMDCRWREGWFGDDSSTLHLLLTLLLLLLHQLHLRS